MRIFSRNNTYFPLIQTQDKQFSCFLQQNIWRDWQRFATQQPSMDFDSIRQQQQKLMDQKVQDKRAIAIKYTQQQFAPYVSDKDLLKLCEYIELYSAKLPLSHVEPINIKGLVALDLFHFGWNIWNHFRVGKQDEISQFLKQVFATTFKDVEVGSIKSHLRDDEKKGTIPIVQSLSDHQIIE